MRRVVTTLIDDLNGSEADETVTFSLDGKTYEIDLTHSNADGLRDTFAPYLKAGRRTSSKNHSGTKELTSAARSWAKKNGYKVNDRGRVPYSIQAAYKKFLASTS